MAASAHSSIPAASGVLGAEMVLALAPPIAPPDPDAAAEADPEDDARLNNEEVLDTAEAEVAADDAADEDDDRFPLPEVFTETQPVDATLEAWLNPANWPAIAQNLVHAGIILVIGLLVLFLLKAILRGLVLAERVPPVLGGWLERVIQWLVVLVFGLFALEAIGLLENVWGVISAVLALVAIGFVAVWSILSNVMCTFMLLIFRPFNIGDEIEILEPTGTSGLKGKVVHLNVMFTTLEEDPAVLTANAATTPNGGGGGSASPGATNGSAGGRPLPTFGSQASSAAAGAPGANAWRGGGDVARVGGARSVAAAAVADRSGSNRSLANREVARRQKIMERWEARQRRIDAEESRVFVQVPNNTFFQKVIRRRPARRGTTLDAYLQKEIEQSESGGGASTASEPSSAAAKAAIAEKPVEAGAATGTGSAATGAAATPAASASPTPSPPSAGSPASSSSPTSSSTSTSSR